MRRREAKNGVGAGRNELGFGAGDGAVEGRRDSPAQDEEREEKDEGNECRQPKEEDAEVAGGIVAEAVSPHARDSSASR